MMESKSRRRRVSWRKLVTRMQKIWKKHLRPYPFVRLRGHRVLRLVTWSIHLEDCLNLLLFLADVLLSLRFRLATGQTWQRVSPGKRQNLGLAHGVLVALTGLRRLSWWMNLTLLNLRKS